MPYKLAYRDRYIPMTDENIGSLLDGCDPFVFLDENQKTPLTLNVTGREYTELLSALIIGAKLMYLEKWTYLYALMLEAAQCPVQLTEEGDCRAYPVWSPFVTWYPVNPFLQPDLIPDGFLQPPFTIHDGGGSLPPVYEAGDVILPLSSLSAGAFTASSNAPRLEIRVIGSGQIELDLLALPGGGRLLVGIDDPPSLDDVLDGILTPSEILLELNLDNSSFPPEDDASVQHEINIDAGAGVETVVYLTFLPTIDLNEFPIQYGGGIKEYGIQLCGFEQEAMVSGITDLALIDGELRYVKDGQTIVAGNVLQDCDDVEDCLSVSSVVSGLNAAIQANGNNIALNTTVIQENKADILLNTTVIQENKAGITTLESNVALNTTVIQENKADILLNTTVIQENKDRIIALENAPTGGSGDFDTELLTVKRLTHTETWDTDQANILVPVPVGYDAVEVIIHMKATYAQLERLRMWCNQDIIPASYAWHRANTAFSSNVIADLGSNNGGDMETIITIRIDGLQRSQYRTFLSEFVSASASSVYAYRGAYGVTWERTEELSEITFYGQNADIAANGSIEVYGIREREVLVSPEIVTWTAELDFATTDATDVLNVAVGSYNSGAWYSGNSWNGKTGIGFNLTLGEAFESVQFEADYNLIQNSGSGIASVEINTGNNDTQVYIPTFGNDITQDMGYSGNSDDFFLDFYADTDDALSTSQFVIKKLRIIGTGTVPPLLQSYIV